MNLKIKIDSKKLEIIILSFIFVSMLLLNFITPLIADDYSYALKYDHTRIKNLFDIIEYQINHYMVWGGRTIAHTIAQIFLIFPKWIFNIFNALVYTLNIYIIYQMCKNYSKKSKPYIMLIAYLLLYFVLPVFGQNCLWLVGSCNYLWTMFIMMLLLYQYVNDHKKNDNSYRIIIIFLLGVLAGWTNENIAVGLISIIFAFIIKDKMNNKIKKWKISGLIGCISGFLIMILAPGNYVRNKNFVDNSFILLKWLKRFISCTLGIYHNCFYLIVILIILFTIYIYNNKKINYDIYIFIFGAIISVYAMILSPIFSERSWFGIIVFLIIPISILLYSLDEINNIFKPILYDVLIISLLIYFVDFSKLASDIFKLNNVWKERIEMISTSSDDTLRFKQYSTNNKKNPNYALTDIDLDSNSWPNVEIGFYFNKKIEGSKE